MELVDKSQVDKYAANPHLEKRIIYYIPAIAVGIRREDNGMRMDLVPAAGPRRRTAAIERGP